MTKQEFNLLSNKYLQGMCSVEEELLLLEWSEKLDKENQLKISSSEKEEIRGRILRNIHSKIPNKQFSKITKIGIGIVTSLAACLLIVFLLNVQTIESLSTKPSNLLGMEMKNMTLVDQKILLKELILNYLPEKIF